MKRAILWLSVLVAVGVPAAMCMLRMRDGARAQDQLASGLAVLRTPIERALELSPIDLRRAQASFDAARSAPSNPDLVRVARANWYVAQTYLDLEDGSAVLALQAADTAARLDAESPDTMLARAIVALRRGQTADAEQRLDVFLSRTPPAPLRARAQLALLEHLLDVHRAADAEALAEALDRDHPAVGRVKNFLGLAREGVGDRDGARQAFSAACSLDPHEAAPWINLARVDRASGNLNAAHDDLQRALNAAPEHPEAWLALGVVLGELRDASARAALAHAATLAPESAGPWIAQGDLDLSSGDVAHAVESYREALTRDVDAPGARTNLGVALARAGDRPAALAAFEEATRRAPHMGEAWNGLGAMRLAEGDAEGALGALQQASALLPDDPNPPMNLARAFESLSRWDEAARALREVLRRDPTHTLARDHLQRITAPVTHATVASRSPSASQG